MSNLFKIPTNYQGPRVIDSIVQVEVKTQYGQNRFYPVNANAKHFAALTGGKTLTPIVLKVLEQVGFSIEYLTGPPND